MMDGSHYYQHIAVTCQQHLGHMSTIFIKWSHDMQSVTRQHT